MCDFIHDANSFKKLVVFWSYYLMDLGKLVIYRIPENGYTARIYWLCSRFLSSNCQRRDYSTILFIFPEAIYAYLFYSEVLILSSTALHFVIFLKIFAGYDSGKSSFMICVTCGTKASTKGCESALISFLFTTVVLNHSLLAICCKATCTINLFA